MNVTSVSLPDPMIARKLAERATRLGAFRETHQGEVARMTTRIEGLDASLAAAPKVESALQELQQTLFDELTRVLQEKLTVALQEVLEQPIVFKAIPAFRNNRLEIDFHVERDNSAEDILRGQGGSVANVLSVGLRLFALTTLDPKRHRRLLVLDEQDCWLRPDLVPRLVKIIHDAGKALGFQVLLISHHDLAVFRQYADRIYSFCPQPDGSVKVELHQDTPIE